MKVSRILQLIVVVSALFMVGLAERATAVTVTIHHDGGILSGTLSRGGLLVDSNGNITLTVNNLTSGGSTCENQAPSISLDPPKSASVGSPIFATFTTSDPDGDTVTVTANYGEVNSNSWSWTPSTAGDYTVILTANDGQICNSTSFSTFTIQVISSSTPPPSNRNYIDITYSGRFPNSLRNQSVAPANSTTNPSAAYYKFAPTESFNWIIVYLQAEVNDTRNYTDGIDLIVSAGVEPSCSDIERGTISSGPNIWYNSNLGRGNETVYISNPTPNTTYYIAVCNFTPNVTGKFTISWSGLSN